MPAIELFLASLTQFRHGFNGPTGLDYAGVESTARMMRLEMSPGLFEKLRACEQEYLSILAARRPQPTAT